MAKLSTNNQHVTGLSAPGFKKYPDYSLGIVQSHSLHQLILNEAVIAATNQAFVVREENLRDVLYIPRDDILIPLTRMKGQSSYCPFKGTANYWNLEANGKKCDGIGWSYDLPYEECAPIKGFIAFYLNKLDCYWRNGIEQPLLGPGPCQGEDCFKPMAA